MPRRTSSINSCRRTMIAVVTVGVTLAMLGVGCASSGDDDDVTAPSAASAEMTSAERTFVGEVEGTDAFVAVVTDGKRVLAYLCDGKAIWNYLDGTATDSAVSATEPGSATAIDAVVDGTTVTGTVVLDDGGAPHRFTAQLATGSAGFFRRGAVLDGSVRLGGWIRLDSGEVRGKQLTVDVSGPGTGTTTTDDSSDTGTTVPPDAAPASLLGLAACGIAGMRVAIATNRFNRDQSPERLQAANEAIEIANSRCGAGAAA